MNFRDQLRAAARCWERTGFFKEAAERFTTAEAWRDAGRCFSQAERHTDAALAYSRAGELLLEAKEHLMGSTPERARPLYERLQSGSFISPSAQVEVLLGLGGLEKATRVAFTSGDREAVVRLARLASTRGRLDLAAPWCLEESFAPWNRSLRWQHAPSVAETSKIWPSVEFSEVALVPLWEMETGDCWWGDRALDWSADGTFFAAALDSKGFARGRVGSHDVFLKRWPLSEKTSFIRFLPASRALLAGIGDGAVSLFEEDGSVRPMENLHMPRKVFSITFAPEKDRVAVAAWTSPGALLKVWSWQAGQVEVLLDEFREPVGDCYPLAAWSPDGRRFCWSPGPRDQPNRLFFLGNQSLEAHSDVITSLTFTADGRFLITASGDQTLVVRDGKNGERFASPERFDSLVYGATVHLQAALVAVGEGKRLHLLRLNLGEVPRLSRLSEQTLDEYVTSLAFSPDGRHLLVMTEQHLHLFRVDLKP